mgnify:CR=1 FL=1|jgi:hypothetical protein|tara:strand:+ start:1797 stop:2216 length:420 start_codon:yes stop_codon:yes gene_type:complete
MHALKTTLSVPSDETVLEAEFGLYIYSHMSRDQLSALLESQGGYVEQNKMLFFIRLLDEKDRKNGEFQMNTYRVMKDESSATEMLNTIQPILQSIPDSGGGTVEHTISEMTYDEFVELQAKVGTKYYFPGLADELEKYE